MTPGPRGNLDGESSRDFRRRSHVARVPTLRRKVNVAESTSFAVHAGVDPVGDTVAAVRPRRPRAKRRVRTARAGSCAILLASLGACGGTEFEVEPTFDGEWAVTGLELGGAEIELDGAALIIEIDTTEAALRGSTGCGRLFGSYTLSIDADPQAGIASFTVPSRLPDDSCPAVDRQRHVALVTALESVTRWRRSTDSLILEASPETTVELRPLG